MRPAGDHGVPMRERQALRRREEVLELGEQHVRRRPELEREPRVQHVGGRQAVVDPPAGRPDRPGHDVDEGGDVVARHGLAFGHGLDRERRAFPAGGGVLGGNHAQLRPRLHGQELDLEPVRQPGPVRPDRLDLGEAVARDHSRRPSARSILELPERRLDRLVAEGHDLGGEDGRVHGRVDADRGDRDARGHLRRDRERLVAHHLRRRRRRGPRSPGGSSAPRPRPRGGPTSRWSTRRPGARARPPSARTRPPGRASATRT